MALVLVLALAQVVQALMMPTPRLTPMQLVVPMHNLTAVQAGPMMSCLLMTLVVQLIAWLKPLPDTVVMQIQMMMQPRPMLELQPQAPQSVILAMVVQTHQSVVLVVLQPAVQAKSAILWSVTRWAVLVARPHPVTAVLVALAELGVQTMVTMDLSLASPSLQQRQQSI
jgi:hypothetical protein